MLQELQRRGVMVLVTSRRALGTCLGRAAQLRLGALSAKAGAELLADLAGTGVEWGAGEAERGWCTSAAATRWPSKSWQAFSVASNAHPRCAWQQ